MLEFLSKSGLMLRLRQMTKHIVFTTLYIYVSYVEWKYNMEYEKKNAEGYHSHMPEGSRAYLCLPNEK